MVSPTSIIRTTIRRDSTHPAKANTNRAMDNQTSKATRIMTKG